MRANDPSRMSRDDIMAELGELLATGYRRHISTSKRRPADVLNGEKPLDDRADAEAPCGGEPKEIQT